MFIFSTRRTEISNESYSRILNIKIRVSSDQTFSSKILSQEEHLPDNDCNRPGQADQAEISEPKLSELVRRMEYLPAVEHLREALGYAVDVDQDPPQLYLSLPADVQRDVVASGVAQEGVLVFLFNFTENRISFQ